MTRKTFFLSLIPILISIVARGQSDTTYYFDKTGFTYKRNDTTFEYHHERLVSITIKLPKQRVKNISYYRGGKIESICFSRLNKKTGSYQNYGKRLGFYRDSTVRFKVLYAKNGRVRRNYFYYPDGKIQCKTCWTKQGNKKKIISYDEYGNKTNINFQPRGSRIDECE